METLTGKVEAKQSEANVKGIPFGRSFFLRVFIAMYAALLLIVLLFAESIPVPVPFFSIALSIATAFLLALVLTYSITRPIAALADAARRVVEGDVDVSVPSAVKRQDEIGQLFRFFTGAVTQIRENREREFSLSQIKSQFVMVAAHQLRTPLSALKWSLRLMLDGDMGEINEKQREFLQQSYQTNEHIIRLVNDFLDISRIEEGRFGFQFQKIKILDIIQKVVEASKAQATIRGVRMLQVNEAPPELEIIADESRMYTALANVLDNAVRYSNAGQEVVVRTTLSDGMLEISITDTGIGIPSAEQPKIFSRFYRASNAIRQQTEGSGLGLFITRNIVEHHGGTVGFMSEEQKGTTVFFRLPAKEDFVKR